MTALGGQACKPTQNQPFTVPDDKLITYCIYNNRIYTAGAVICETHHHLECTNTSGNLATWALGAADCTEDSPPSPS
ncbi:DUF1496 domain-containing protein [Mesorhizobium sp. AR07]|uniref:DUF1496 domain-containing protein n=1 Tax=Mesorhizobium sp. AR07 TaxID=2865838 RepID=UPI0039B6FA8D